VRRLPGKGKQLTSIDKLVTTEKLQARCLLGRKWLIFKNQCRGPTLARAKLKVLVAVSAGAGKKDTRKTLTNRRKWTGDEQHNQRMFKEPDSQPPQRDGGETYEPAPLRYMRSARSGPSDDSLSWVVGKKTRAEHSSGPRKQGRSFWDVEL
jgi:hypothetical protein